MFCFDTNSCVDGYRCAYGYCIRSSVYSSDNHGDLESDNAESLPIIGAIVHDLPSLRVSYFVIFSILILIGLINNIVSLITFIRDRIRYTIGGIYLITYSTCSLLLMILIPTDLIAVLYYENYYIRLWTCHGYPYLSLIMVYSSILLSTAIAIEGVLNRCFQFDKYRPRQRAILISISIVLIVSIINLDKIFARHLITDPSGRYSCTIQKSFYKFSSNSLIYIYLILSCLIHFVCLISILLVKTKENCLEKIFHYQNYLIPSLFIILCLFLYTCYRYLSHWTTSLEYQIRLHIAFLCVLYAPQIFTYMIYVFPDEFYVKEFYQIWFYRKLCCCFYSRRRRIQEFVVIHKLWQRRTSLETMKTIATLDDAYVESEFYKK